MPPSGNEPPMRAGPPLVLDYQPPSIRVPPVPPDRRAVRVGVIVRVMAVAWIVVTFAAGVASDHVRIPVPKKIAITASGLIIAFLFGFVKNRPHIAWAYAFSAFMM